MCLEFCVIYARKPVIVTHYLASLNSHRSGGTKDVTYLTCHMILQDHVI